MTSAFTSTKQPIKIFGFLICLSLSLLVHEALVIELFKAMQDIKFPQCKKMLGILNISKILIWNATRWLYGDMFIWNRKSISGLCIFLKKIFHSYSLKSWNWWHSLKVSIQNCNWIHCKGVSKVTKLFYAMGVESEMENKSEQASTALCICWFFWYSHCLFRS